jgi:hypothetical protein
MRILATLLAISAGLFALDTRAELRAQPAPVAPYEAHIYKALFEGADQSGCLTGIDV